MLSALSRFMRVSREERVIRTFRLHSFLSNCQQGSIFFFKSTHTSSESSFGYQAMRNSESGQSTNRSNAWILVLLRFVIPDTVLWCKKSVIYAKIFAFIHFHYVYIKKESKTRGSRSTKSLVIDMKVKIFACNVEALEADPECVQILLQEIISLMRADGEARSDSHRTDLE